MFRVGAPNVRVRNMVAAFPVSVLMISVSVTVTAALITRHHHHLAPVADHHQSLMAPPPRGGSRFPRSPRGYAVTASPAGLPLGSSWVVFPRVRQINDSVGNDDLQDRMLSITFNLNNPNKGNELNVIGGHNKVHIDERKHRLHENGAFVEPQQDRGYASRKVRRPLLLLHAAKLFHKILPVPINHADRGISGNNDISHKPGFSQGY